jgi:hypothetical protein
MKSNDDSDDLEKELNKLYDELMANYDTYIEYIDNKESSWTPTFYKNWKSNSLSKLISKNYIVYRSKFLFLDKKYTSQIELSRTIFKDKNKIPDDVKKKQVEITKKYDKITNLISTIGLTQDPDLVQDMLDLETNLR